MDRVQAASGATSRWHEKGRVAIGGSAPVVRHVCFDLLGLEICICETKEAARIAAQRGGRRPASGGHDVGNNSKPVRVWRALSRTLCDTQLLVFNIGRANFRSKFVEPFTIMIQASSSNAMGLQEVGLTAPMHMVRAGAALKDAGGIIMILDRIMIAASGATAAAQPRNCQLKNTGAGITADTLGPQMLAVVPWFGETFTSHFVGRNNAGGGTTKCGV